MKTLFILNDAPYGSERSYNGLRLAGALSKAEGEEVKLFLIDEARRKRIGYGNTKPIAYEVFRSRVALQRAQ